MESVIPMIALQGSVMVDGSVLEGIQKLDWGNSYLIDAKVLSQLIEKSQSYAALEKKYNALEASNTNITRAIKAGGLGASDTILELNSQLESLRRQFQEAHEENIALKLENQKLSEVSQEPIQKDLVPADYNRYLNRLSAEARGRKRQQATAISLSLAICGKEPFEIAAALGNRGFGNSAAYVSRLLSTLDDGDKVRLKNAMQAHPEEFVGLTSDDFEQWFTKRHERQKKSHDKRLNKRLNSWGE